MALNIQAGARSLIQVGLSVSDIGALFQFGRVFGNWLRVTSSDNDLFVTLCEDYGVMLKRGGLVDLVQMENCWSHQLHLIHEGDVIHDNAKSRKENDGQLGSFSWLMVAIVTALDPCLTSVELRSIIVELFVKLLDRDDEVDVRESLQMQIQTNIESWRSTGVVRGMQGPLHATFKTCRSSLAGTTSVPHLTRAERRELLDFLVWLLAGKSDHISLLSATLYSVAAALETARIQVDLGEPNHSSMGQLVIHYVNDENGTSAMLGALRSVELFSERENNTVPPTRVSYLAYEPSHMIKTLPCAIQIRNELAKYWHRGAEAAAKVRLKAVARIRRTGVKYIVGQYDECTSLWPGQLTDLSSEHFPVDSETLLISLNDLIESLPEHLKPWFYRCAKLDAGINDLDNTFTVEQMDVFLCLQSLVFGYWYKLLEPWVSRTYLKEETYLYGVWGYRDTYLLVMIRAAATQLRLGNSKLTEGLSREEMLRLLGAMFAGRFKDNTGRPRKQKPILSHGMVAILDRVSVVSMSLLNVTDDAQHQARFAVVSLPIVNVFPDSDGELWTGDALGIQFRECPSPTLQPLGKVPRLEWSVHPKMTTVDGRLSDVMMMARCGGVVVGGFNPADADAALLRAEENRSGHLCPKEPGIGQPLYFLNTHETHFQSGIITRTTRKGDIILVHSYASPVMRYSAAGFYAQEAHMVIAHSNFDDAVRSIRAQMCGRIESCGYGVIIA